MHLAIPSTALGLFLVSTATAQFDPQLPVAAPAGPTDIEFIDLDADGDLDLVACEFFDGRIIAYENSGDGNYLPGVRLEYAAGSVFVRPLELTPIDADGDGQIDVAAVGDTGISWWRSNGDGTFDVERSISASARDHGDVVAADVDGDGAQDLLVSSFDTDDVTLYSNQGGGTFAPPVTVAPGLDGARGLAVGDVDGDGVPDLVACAQLGHVVAWYRGLGGGAFGPATLISTAIDGPGRLRLHDLDGDGHLDLVTTFIQGDAVGVNWNVGGSFGPSQIVDPSLENAFGVAVADIDDDGDVDLAATSLTLDRVVLYENLGSNSFGPPTVVDGVKDYPWAVVFADVDGDQDLDVMSSARSDRLVYLNRNASTIGSIYCTSLPNATGAVTSIQATGSANVSNERLALGCTQMPTNSTGFFLASMTQGMVNMPAGSRGVLCLGGAIGRFIGPSEVLSSGSSGSFQLVLDVNSIPQPTGHVPVDPGSTWNFQAWHRESFAGMATSNFSDAVTISF